MQISLYNRKQIFNTISEGVFPKDFTKQGSYNLAKLYPPILFYSVQGE